MKKLFIILVMSTCSVSLNACSTGPDSTKQLDSVNRSNLDQSIAKGMSMDQVRSAFGEPLQSQSTADGTQWIYINYKTKVNVGKFLASSISPVVSSPHDIKTKRLDVTFDLDGNVVDYRFSEASQR